MSEGVERLYHDLFFSSKVSPCALVGPDCAVKFSSFLLTGCLCHLFGMRQVDERTEAVVRQHCSSYQSSFFHAVRAISGLLAAFCPNSSGGESGELQGTCACFLVLC